MTVVGTFVPGQKFKYMDMDELSGIKWKKINISGYQKETFGKNGLTDTIILNRPTFQ